jgi:hypothetical protein
MDNADVYELDIDLINTIAKRYGLQSCAAFSKMSHNSNNEVFITDSDFVIKVFISATSVAAPAKEAALYKIMPATVPVPQCVGFDESLEIIPFPYLVLRKVPGETLSGCGISFRHLTGGLFASS